MTALVKFCHKCKDEKPISEFQKCRRNKDGLQTYCKRCRTTNADVFDWKKESAERNVRRCSSCRQVLDRSLFYANSRRCKQCAKQAASDWKSQNPERARENDKQWREQNKARKKKNDRLYYVRNAEEITSRKRRQYDEDEAYRNKIRISNYNSYHRNLKRNQDVRLLRSLFAPDYIKQMKLRDYQNNTESYKHRARQRKARVRGASGRHTRREWLDLCVQFGNRCACCGEMKTLTVDHVIPIIQGGTNDITNIQPLCLQCNLRKGTLCTDYR